MNSRGFTLFTALIAFILIVLAMMLVQSMISTETSISEIVSDTSEQQEMQAVADLVRADAMQGFNYAIRYAIEELSVEHEYIIFKSDIEACDASTDSWTTLQQKFVSERFGVAPANCLPDDTEARASFANRAAGHLIYILDTTRDARGYDIELENSGESDMANTLDRSFDEQSSRGEFFEVFDCEDGRFIGCTGTFYVTLDLSPIGEDGFGMSDADYEKFPLIKITNTNDLGETITPRVLKEPILPRGKFRIYVPIRLFKGLAAAKKVGEAVFDLGPFDNEAEARTAIRSAVNQVRAANGNFEDEGFDLVGEPQINVIERRTNEDEADGVSWFEVTLTFEETDDDYKINTTTPNEYKFTVRRYLQS